MTAHLEGETLATTALVTGPRWVHQSSHRAFLLDEARRLFAFFGRASLNPKGGFFTLDDDGEPIASQFDPVNGASRQIHDTTRMVHCYSAAYLMGLPGADVFIDHGMDYIWKFHRDTRHGGYFWGVSDGAPTNATKQAYGHAFVLLAASSAKVVGHPDADRLLADITAVIEERFWDKAHGATTEEYTTDWQSMGDYRGQNSNMHLTESTMAAFEATGDRRYLAMAESIADLIIRRLAGDADWCVPEHFNSRWEPDRAYDGNPMFRPYGTTPGHSLEWSRLLVQLWQLGGRRKGWMPTAAKAIFRKAVTDGWDHATGGFYYTLEWDGSPRIRNRFWWPAAEGIGAAAALASIDADPFYESWYRRIWNFTARRFIDKDRGGWFPQLNDAMERCTDPFFGKPDLYHAVQACLIPLLPSSGSLTRGLVNNGVSLSVVPA